MRKLLIDLGNSNASFALSNGNELGEVFHLSCPAEFERATVESIASLCAHQKISDVFLASVRAPIFNEQLVSALSQRFNTQVYQAEVLASAYGVTVAYPEPTQFGVDRWLALLAAKEQSPYACAVVDIGTAVTFDWMDADGKHQGGAILAGVQAQINNFYSSTAVNSSRSQTISKAHDGFASNTPDALEIAAKDAVVGFVEKSLNRVIQCQGISFRIMVTGGGAAWLASELPMWNMRQDVALVLKGLQQLSRGRSQ